MNQELKLRPLEREDLKFVHELNNNAHIMSYWFEEPYEAFVEYKTYMINIYMIKANADLSLRKTMKWLD